MVVDTSVLIAALFNEKTGPWCTDRLNENRGSLRMSTVNLTEILILVRDRQPQIFQTIRETIFNSGIRFVPPSTRQAEIAAEARSTFPLNLGDCFAYALAKEESCAVLTLDLDFRKVDIPVVCP